MGGVSGWMQHWAAVVGVSAAGFDILPAELRAGTAYRTKGAGCA